MLHYQVLTETCNTEACSSVHIASTHKSLNTHSISDVILKYNETAPVIVVTMHNKSGSNITCSFISISVYSQLIPYHNGMQNIYGLSVFISFYFGVCNCIMSVVFVLIYNCANAQVKACMICG